MASARVDKELPSESIWTTFVGSCFCTYRRCACILRYRFKRPLTSSPPSALKGCRLRGKDGDSSCETAMSGRENVDGSVDVTLVCRGALAASPFSYSKTFDAFR